MFAVYYHPGRVPQVVEVVANYGRRALVRDAGEQLVTVDAGQLVIQVRRRRLVA